MAALDSRAKALEGVRIAAGKAAIKKSAKDESGTTSMHKRGKARTGRAAGKTTKQKKKSGGRDCKKGTRKGLNGKGMKMDGNPQKATRLGKRAKIKGK